MTYLFMKPTFMNYSNLNISHKYLNNRKIDYLIFHITSYRIFLMT